MLSSTLGIFTLYFALEGLPLGWRLPRVESCTGCTTARRLEVVTSFHKHPLERVVNSVIGAVLGLSPEAGACYTLCTALDECFYLTNWRTPHGVGDVFQRPEMHRSHHQHGDHRNNYGDIVRWDMLFGTYENPPAWDGRCGFDAAREERLGAMRMFRGVHRGR